MSSFPTSFPLTSTTLALRSCQHDLLAGVNEVCERIEAFEPYIQALLPEPGRRERLFAEAASLQQRFPDPALRPPLYGVLLGVKDIFRSDGFLTRAGSEFPPALFVGPEASSVSRLREAGVLVLGKTVTAEFASDEPGPTRNPHHLAHTPGGSSSGSAAAVAAGFCSLALGTQTGGSIIRPAAFCGIVGFKPTYARITTDGVIPHAKSLDTIGLFAQDVSLIAIAASLLCCGWREMAVPQTTPVLAVPDGPYLAQASPEALAYFEQHMRLLEKAGYTIKHMPTLSNIQTVKRMYRDLSSAEMAQVHAVWFVTYEALYRPRTAAKIRAGQQVSEGQVEQARGYREAFRAELGALMRQEGIDLWVCPAATGSAPEGIAHTGDTAMNLPWSYAGMPALTLPAGGAMNGLPLGVQVVGSTMADEQLLRWAAPMADVLREHV